MNQALRSPDEVLAANQALEEAGLVRHGDAPKNWDALVALGTFLERVPRDAPILDMGAPRYSPLLRWLYLYGYRSLTAIDLVYEQPRTFGPLRQLPMDLTATSFGDETFGGIACLSVIEHGVDVERYLDEIARILRPGGVVVTSTDYWPSGVDTAGREAYGHPVYVFDRQALESFVAAAARHGLHPTTTLDLSARDRVVHWGRMNLDYTFAVIVLERQANA